MKVNFDYLVLEITRKCNMRCPHCLRGPRQPIDMDLKIISRIMENVDYISCVTFTGGEPSLNANAINHFRWANYYNNTQLGRFWLTINARYFKHDFYDAILDLYSICEFQEDCILTISGDQYHGKCSNNALDIYCELPFFTKERMKEIEHNSLVYEGSAKKNQLGGCEVNVPHRISESEYVADDDILNIRDTIYINAKGDVLLSCDLSYVRQKKHVIGNVMQEPLSDILMRQVNIISPTV